MALEIKITDQQIRPSQEFINFITRFRSGFGSQESWFDQLSEHLKQGGHAREETLFREVAGTPITDELVKEALLRSYRYTVAILLGEQEVLKSVQDRHKFIFVVGCPRSGGSYLTKQLYMALGQDPACTPALLAHDGFPKAWPFYLQQNHNQHTDMTRYLAEYLVMVELYFKDKMKTDGRITVPKKDINAAYHGSFYNHIFGDHIEYLITLRHPVSCCISSYEKSGGLPGNQRFAARSTIEQFIQRDNLHTGASIDQLSEMNYFDAYLRYWEQYHHNLALSGMCSGRTCRIVPYQQQAMMDTANDFCSRFDSSTAIDEFKVFGHSQRHKDWIERSQEAIQRVRGTWELVGLPFPLAEIQEAW